MTRVTFVIVSLGPGGAQRVLSIMANHWASRGWAITLLTRDGGNVSSYYDLHPAIAHRAFGATLPNMAALRWPLSVLRFAIRFRKLREAIRSSQPDVVISFLNRTNVRVLEATRSLGLPVIVSERVDPHEWAIGGNMWEWLRCFMYPRATYVVVQTERAKRYFSPGVQTKTKIIPNPVALPECQSYREKPDGERHPKTLIAMGRLVEQKGFDLLLEAFATVANKHPDWSLDIWGQGPLRPDLEKQADELGLNGRVRFPGITKHPYEKLSHADLFVLSSRFEGFPNVLCEAMVCGLPVVSFDCPSGPSEIIRDGVDGVLIPPEDVYLLTEALDRLMKDDVERGRLGAAAPQVAERFSIEKVMGIWEQLVESCL